MIFVKCNFMIQIDSYLNFKWIPTASYQITFNGACSISLQFSVSFSSSNACADFLTTNQWLFSQNCQWEIRTISSIEIFTNLTLICVYVCSRLFALIHEGLMGQEHKVEFSIFKIFLNRFYQLR